MKAAVSLCLNYRLSAQIIGRCVMELKFKRSDLPQKWASAAASAVIHHKAQMQEAQTSVCTISFWDEREIIQSYCGGSEKRRK